MNQIDSTIPDAIEMGEEFCIYRSTPQESCKREINNRFTLSIQREQVVLRIEVRLGFDENAEPI
jgi:hypothetical protein